MSRLPTPATKLTPFSVARDGLRVSVKVQPGARRTVVDGVVALAGGESALKVRVAAAPEGGKANGAVIALLAREWGLPKGAIELVAGAGARQKRLRVTGDPVALKARLESWLDAVRGEGTTARSGGGQR